MNTPIIITQRQREILECMFDAWADNGMPLYGGISLQEALEFMEQSFAVDVSDAEQKIVEIQRRIDNERISEQ